VANTGLGSGNTVQLWGNANTMTSVVWDRQIPALQARGVTVNFEPNPLPSVTVSPTSLTIDTRSAHPSDRIESFTYVLDQEPTGNVRAEITSSNTQIARASDSSGLFVPNSGNQWDRPKTILVQSSQGVSGNATIDLAFSGSGYDRVTAQIPVRVGAGVPIPDTNLQAGLNAALGKPAGDVVLRSELEGLTTLSIRNRSITDLTGLEHATSLSDLNIGGNGSLTNLGPLSGLTSLTRINLNGTGVSNLTPLSGLRNLRRLDLVNARVSNLTPLSGLTNLRELFLRNDGANITGNSISDVSPQSLPIARQSRCHQPK